MADGARMPSPFLSRSPFSAIALVPAKSAGKVVADLRSRGTHFGEGRACPESNVSANARDIHR